MSIAEQHVGADLVTVPYNSNSAGAQAVWNTYAAGFLRFYSPTTRAIHPSYNQLEEKKEPAERVLVLKLE